MLYTLLLGLAIGLDNKSILKVLSNNIFITTFILILIQFKEYKEFSTRLSRWISYGFIFTGLISILMYSFHVYGIILSFNSPFIKVLDEHAMMEYFKEIRFQSFFSQKAKFASFCLIGMFLLSINSKLNAKIKFIGIVILFLNIILTNSVTAMIASIALLWLSINFKKVSVYLRYPLYLVFILIFAPYVRYVFNYMNSVRDLDSLGSRGEIWSYAIEFYRVHPFGVIDNWYFYSIGNQFKGAHNIFLNEILDYGIIGGLIFFIVYIIYFYSLFKIDKRTLRLFIPITIVFSIDNILYNEIVPIFWFSYLLIKAFLKGNDSTVKSNFSRSI
ncbi:O-antigen ligase family protein [Fictibacillus sp. S7]|uniref:O-antigen ligase family protein n=1 Tax=Fictibacillus sp. S7 TaxID=2212476 RepID=UPI001F519236|nr:O-antigen ligase family protein [Fictibacillus sp. S7]